MMASSSNLSKKQKVIDEETQEDQISELPDPLLVQILSLMPTKDAFKTCILSKRWSYLWTFVYNFKFSRSDFRKAKNFVSFVDYVLAHSVSSKIKKFELQCTCYSQIKRWISLAVEKKVEHVVLFSHSDAYLLPESFFTCSSLITFHLYESSLISDIIIVWKSLKSIKLEYMVLSNDHIVNIMSGCPALETMDLHYVEGFSRLDINSLKFKTLKLKDFSDSDGHVHSLEILAPYLQHLEISGYLYNLTCRLVDVSSVINSKLTFDIICTKDTLGEQFDQVFKTLGPDYFQKLSCAPQLTIGTWFTQVLCILQFKEVPITELKCKELTLELHMEKFNLYGVAGLLRASPLVETLNINMENTRLYGSWCHTNLTFLAKGDDIDLQRYISSFVFPNLKNVKIVSSIEVCLKDRLQKTYIKKIFRISDILLKNAAVLEKFMIITKRRKCKRCSKNCLSRYLCRMAEELLDCPRSSTNCVVIFLG